MHYQGSRPRGGACYLDFLDVWLQQALAVNDPVKAADYARQIGHWALLMHPDLAEPRPPTRPRRPGARAIDFDTDSH